MYYFDSHIQYCSNVYNSTTFAVAGSQSEREANDSLTNHIPRLLNFEKRIICYKSFRLYVAINSASCVNMEILLL